MLANLKQTPLTYEQTRISKKRHICYHGAAVAGIDCSDDVSRSRLTHMENLRIKGRVPSAANRHGGFE